MKQKTQAFIGEVLAKQENNLFLWAPFFLAVGIAIYFGLKFEPPLWSSLGSFAVTTAGLMALYKKQDHSIFYQLNYRMMIAVTLAVLGFLLAQVKAHLVHTPMILKKISITEVIGTIEQIEPLGKKGGSRVILSDVDIERMSAENTPRKIRLKIRKDEGLQAGQRIKILAGLNPPGAPVFPGGFDFQRMSYFKGIGAVGFAYKTPEILNKLDTSPSLLAQLRAKITEKVASQIKGDAPQRAIVTALMTGQRGAITDQDWDALRQSGLAHLLAISGLHVGMVAGVLFFFSRLLMAFFPSFALQYPIKKYAAGIALVGAFFYTLTVGATIPTQRALMMTGLVMIAIMFDRSPFSLRLVALAAMAVLIFSPESLTSVSFQMSFAAVVTLICFYEKTKHIWTAMRRKAGFIRKVALYFVGVSTTTVVAGTATGLFSLYHFQTYAMYGLLANLVAVPLMGFVVMPLIVLSYVLMPFGLEQWTLPLVEWGVHWVLVTAHWVGGMEGAVWHIASFPHWIFISMVCCFWFLMIWKGRLKLIAIPIFMMLLIGIFIHKQADIFISSKIELVAVNSKNGSSHNSEADNSLDNNLLWFSNGRKARYTANQWMRLNGKAGETKLIFPKEGQADNFPLTCGHYGCRGEIKGQKISIAYHANAWKEDCRWADIVISKTPVPYKECDAKHVIDFFDVWRKGNHAIWLSPDGVKIKTVEEMRGQRPWTQISASHKKQ